MATRFHANRISPRAVLFMGNYQSRASRLKERISKISPGRRVVRLRMHDPVTVTTSLPPTIVTKPRLLTIPANTTSIGLLSLAPSSDPPSVWLALGAVIGLPLALWFYKCIMLVLFQRKIIYMGYVPPDARSQELYKDITPAKGVSCEEVQIIGERGIKLHGLIVRRSTDSINTHVPKAVIVYLQGNAGNPLGRLPVFERLLIDSTMTGLHQSKTILDSTVILAVAPRSYWKSSRRTPTEPGLISDYSAALSYATTRFPSVPIILYGHSLGGAVAVCLSAQAKSQDFHNVQGLILENPFASIPWMVKALYPQKWLPYHYLGGFAFDRWDALSAMRDARQGTLLDRLRHDVLVVLSEQDEIVPNEMGRALYNASTGSDGPEEKGSQRLVVVPGVLHDNAWSSRRWRREIELYLKKRIY